MWPSRPRLGRRTHGRGRRCHIKLLGGFFQRVARRRSALGALTLVGRHHFTSEHVVRAYKKEPPSCCHRPQLLDRGQQYRRKSPGRVRIPMIYGGVRPDRTVRRDEGDPPHFGPVRCHRTLRNFRFICEVSLFDDHRTRRPLHYIPHGLRRAKRLCEIFLIFSLRKSFARALAVSFRRRRRRDVRWESHFETGCATRRACRTRGNRDQARGWARL